MYNKRKIKKEFDHLVGRNIRAFRMMKGMTIEELAEKSDVDYTFISELERGVSGCSGFTLAEIADGLGVSITQLTKEAEKMLSDYKKNVNGE